MRGSVRRDTIRTMLPDVGALPEPTNEDDADPTHDRDANGHFWCGPKLARPGILRLMGRAQGSLVDEFREADGERLRIARTAIERHAGAVDAAWAQVKRLTTKRERRKLHLTRADLVEAAEWRLRKAA